ncbi:hypothetical protein [Nonomuraea sp. NPDC049709]|uniref:hypothetical protein n=1 Tax=Nonomuraea sp. NPDC049709 TaxID=3154736 RepID=UPI00343FA86D
MDCTLGSFNDVGPRDVTFDTGGSLDFAGRAGIELGGPEQGRGGERCGRWSPVTVPRC